ncbi:MAG TPA: GNAT family N-acetyltransferase [Gemmatimonadales bacterium]|nr:GNAT family N-acetyltransferase [Gemmatimonadales bacterium]
MNLRHDLRPGDVATIVRLHGEIYALERGWDSSFEQYVADGLGHFSASPDDRRNRIWLVEESEELIGMIGIVADGIDSAQLRWFLVVPAARGRGLGTMLLDRAVRFCRDAGYRSVFLWTVAGLDKAATLYTRSGFTLVETIEHRRWGEHLIEQRYEMELAPLSREASAAG